MPFGVCTGSRWKSSDLNSIIVVCTSEDNILATFDYGGLQVPSIVFKENVFGIQFHPEKSSIDGINLFKEILEI